MESGSNLDPERDELTTRLLGNGPDFVCPFCGAAEELYFLLHVHALDEHTAAFYKARDALGAGEDPSGVFEAERRRRAEEDDEEGRPKAKAQPSRHGQGQRPELKEEPQSPPPPLYGHLVRQSKAQRSLAKLVEAPRLGCGREGSAAERCRHNRRRCKAFPHCLGRYCPAKHPPCARHSPCKLGSHCAYEHVEYEKTCGQCRGRVRPPPAPVFHLSCPHRKRLPCQQTASGKECGRGVRCYWVHGLCEHLYSKVCPSKVTGRCAREHLDDVFICPDCPKK